MVFSELCLFDFRDEPLKEMFIVVNKRLEQCFVQVVSLQTTNDIAFCLGMSEKRGNFFKICGPCNREICGKNMRK